MKNTVLFFVHGGPGLSSSYLKGWFDSLSANVDLHYYDQNYSCVDGRNLIDSLVDQLIQVYLELCSKYEKIIVYTHSWGAFLLLKAAPILSKEYKWGHVSQVIISNPSDTDWKNYELSGNRLIEKATEEELQEIDNCSDGIQMMNMCLPLYVGDRKTIPQITFDRYDLDAYGKIEEEMAGYDLNDEIRCLPLEKTHTIYCENDFEMVDGSKLLSELTIYHSFPKAGHFPFAEMNSEYIALLQSIMQ